MVESETKPLGLATAPASSRDARKERWALCFIVIGHLDKTNLWLQVKTRMALVDSGPVQRLV